MWVQYRSQASLHSDTSLKLLYGYLHHYKVIVAVYDRGSCETIHTLPARLNTSTRDREHV